MYFQQQLRRISIQNMELLIFRGFSRVRRIWTSAKKKKKHYDSPRGPGTSPTSRDSGRTTLEAATQSPRRRPTVPTLSTGRRAVHTPPGRTPPARSRSQSLPRDVGKASGVAGECPPPPVVDWSPGAPPVPRRFKSYIYHNYNCENNCAYPFTITLVSIIVNKLS